MINYHGIDVSRAADGGVKLELIDHGVPGGSGIICMSHEDASRLASLLDSVMKSSECDSIKLSKKYGVAYCDVIDEHLVLSIQHTWIISRDITIDAAQKLISGLRMFSDVGSKKLISVRDYEDAKQDSALLDAAVTRANKAEAELAKLKAELRKMGKEDV